MRSHGCGENRRRVDSYGCFVNHRRGTAICANTVHIRQEALDHAILAAVNRALGERVVELSVEKELVLEARVNRLVEAITRTRSARRRREDRRALEVRPWTVVAPTGPERLTESN